VSQNIKNFASQLSTAYSGQPIAPLRSMVSDTSVDVAYAIQNTNTEQWLAEGRRIVGRKIGLTSKAVQKQLGVDQPDYGMLFSDSTYGSGEVLPISNFLQPKIEAEIAFVLKADLTAEDLTIIDVIGAVDYALAALEIVDSRIENWDISLFDTIADNASYGAFVVSSKPVQLSNLDLENCQMSLLANGEKISSGKGADCLGNPLLATLWLARVMIESGRPLKAGDVILSGALGPMVTVEKNTEYSATIDGLGAVSVTFAA
jgi:2-keto-4-pentenoate hydratase